MLHAMLNVSRALVIAAIVLFSLPAYADVETARAKGLAWLLTQQLGDGSWRAAPGLEVQSTAAALDAITNAGISRGYAFGAAVAWLQNADAPSIDSLSRKAAALKGAGVDVASHFTSLMGSAKRPLVREPTGL